MRTRWVALLVATATLLACGSDYRPPDLPTTGAPAGPLGQVLDVDVEFPDLTVGSQPRPGVRFEMTFELARVGFGEIAARVSYGDARLAEDVVPIEDLSDGATTVTVAPDLWQTTRVGPIRIDGTTIEMILDGTTDDGWRVEGRALGSLGLDEGRFDGWRRHRFLVAGTDFASTVGRVEEVSLVRESEVRVRRRLELVSSDPVLRVADGAVFAINRLTFDNLQRLDPERDYATAWQSSVGAGANPQDVLLLDGQRAYVTRYEPPFDDVAIVDTGGGGLLESIPLDGVADNPDGTPRPTAMRQAAGAVFVALQDIDRSFTRYGDGKLAVIDPALDRMVDVIPLSGRNPVALDSLVDIDGRETLYVALAGIFPGSQPQELSGGVVAVDPLNRVVQRLVLDDDDAGGNVGALAMARASLGYVVVSDASFTNRVIAFDPRDGSVLRTVLETSEFVPQIAVDRRGVLAVPDRRFFDPQTCLYRVPQEDEGGGETLIRCIGTELPPFSLEPLD